MTLTAIRARLSVVAAQPARPAACPAARFNRVAVAERLRLLRDADDGRPLGFDVAEAARDRLAQRLRGVDPDGIAQARALGDAHRARWTTAPRPWLNYRRD
ncbi:MAG: hypothetical protein RQ833_07420 [Sphingomonadaceae bacterium]|nr:hypothetical protein [Sphingomonadaceae bacterium]